MYKIFRRLLILSTISRSLNGVSTLSLPSSIIKNEIFELYEDRTMVSEPTMKIIFITALVLLGGIFAGNLFVYFINLFIIFLINLFVILNNRTYNRLDGLG